MYQFKLTPKMLLINGGWLTYLIYTYYNYVGVANFMAQTSVLLAFFVYFIFQPLYITTFLFFWQVGKSKGKEAWKRIVASVLVVLAGDVTALPRLIITSPIRDGPATSTNIGALFMRAFETFMPHATAHFVTYIVFPFIAVFISIELVGITNWVRMVRKQ